MKKTIVAALSAACMMCATGAMAQQNQQQKMAVPKERPTVEQMAQRRTEKLAKRLDLNEEQTKQVYEVNLKNIQEMEAHRMQMKTERSAEAEQMKKILTTDQFVEWSQMQTPARSKKGEGGKDGKPCREMKRDCSARNAQPAKK